MTHFPDTPHDGEQVVESRGDGAVRIWTYNQAKNEWTYEDYTSAPAGTVMFTDQVLVRENAANEEVHSALADPSELKTQKEVNYYLDEKFGQGPDINLDDYATEAWVEQRFAPKADLYKVEAKVGMGVWKFSREAGAARNGEFRMVTREGAPTETWAAVARFGVNERDRRNMLFDWSRLATGDEVLITNKNNPGNYARFEIDPAQDGVMEVLRVNAQMGRAVNNDDHDIEVVSRDNANYATKTSVEAVAFAMVNQIQSMEAAQGTKSKGKWAHHGGPLPDTGIPAESQFWMANDEGTKTQEYCEAKEIRIHAVGISDQLRSNNVLGAAAVGDRLIIQDLIDLDGCEYEITSVDFHDPDGDNYEEAYAVYGVKPDDTFCRGSVTPAELVSVRIKSSIGGDYLPLSGGTVTGPTTFDCPTMVKWDAASANSYPFSVYGGDKWAFRVGWDGTVKSFGEVIIDQPSGTALRIKKDHVERVKIEHGGRIFCAYDLNLDDDNRTVTTKGWVKEQIAAIPEPEGGGAGFIKSYDGNRFCVGGNMSTDLSSGEVLFMDAEYKQTDNPAFISYISLPKDEFDWSTFTGNGNIKVKAGSATAGYYCAYAFMHQSSEQVLVSVFPLKTYPDKKLEVDSGAPCYFQGVFFG